MIIRENAKYYLIPKNIISLLASLTIIISMAGFAWMWFMMPKELRNGYIPRIEAIEYKLDRKIDVLNSYDLDNRLGDLEDNFYSTRYRYLNRSSLLQKLY